MRFVLPAWGSHKSSHRISHDEQMRLIQDAIERDDRENDKGAAIIVVVDEEARARQVEKKWKKHRWQLWKRRPFVRITTNKRLQDAIPKVSCNEDVNHLTIIACEGVDTISPQVHAPHIRSMRILQCGRQDHIQKVLDIGDAFSFNNKHRGNCACRIGYNGSREFDCTLSITYGREKSSVPLGNEEHEADSPSGTQETKTTGGWWKGWRGFVASAVGLVVAVAKAVSSVTVAVKGYCLSLSWKTVSLCLSKGGATASLSTSAVCVAAAYGVVAFLVLYLVPWDVLFNWIVSTAQSRHNGVLSWCNRGVASGRRGSLNFIPLPAKQTNPIKMPTTSGTVSSFDGGHKISATFVVDGVQCTFNGSFDPPVGDFHSYDAKLDYSDIKQLTTQREFSGKVSSQSLVIDTNNGAKITTHPGTPISPVSRLSGRGNWEHS